MQPQTYARFALPYEHWNRTSKVKHMRLVKLLFSNLQKHCIDSAQNVRQEHSRLDQTSFQVEKGGTLLHIASTSALVIWSLWKPDLTCAREGPGLGGRAGQAPDQNVIMRAHLLYFEPDQRKPHVGDGSAGEARWRRRARHLCIQ